MNLKPLHDWAVIAPSEAEARTAGGLYIPDTAKEKPEEGVVEAIGPGAYEEEKGHKKKEEKKERKFVPTTVKPGDRVLYERYAGQTYKVGGQERILVRERDILGWIERSLLQIPAATTERSSTSLMERPAAPLMNVAKAKAPAKTAKKSAKKKAGKKTAKKAVKKTVKKKTTKKAAAKPKKASKAKGKKSSKKK